MKSIPEKAEIILNYAGRFDSKIFHRPSRFDAHMDESGIVLTLSHGQDSRRRSVNMHIDSVLFAGILRELAKSAAKVAPEKISHRKALAQAASALTAALAPARHLPLPAETDDLADLTAEEEVTLLHILE